MLAIVMKPRFARRSVRSTSARGSLRRRVSTGVAAFLTLAAMATGCTAPRQPEEALLWPVNSVDIEPVWSHTLRVLREHGFEPDRQDRANREIVTLPLTSAQWYEPGRKDVADSYSLAESSLHTIQRTVSVKFLRQDEHQPWTVDVRVDITRLSPPARQITTASSAWNVFSARTPNDEGVLVPRGPGSTQRIALGRDGAMEQRLARAIAQLPVMPPAAPALAASASAPTASAPAPTASAPASRR